MAAPEKGLTKYALRELLDYLQAAQFFTDRYSYAARANDALPGDIAKYNYYNNIYEKILGEIDSRLTSLQKEI